jgi:glycine/D-amino acid oxidase-like deaminating enzyme
MGMDLRSGSPYWLLKNGILETYPPLRKDTSSEVTVIGGGITGALIAHHLVESGAETLLLDRRDIASGSTAASTSLLLHETDIHLKDLVERLGERDGSRIYRMGLEAIDVIERLAGEGVEDCGFERKPCLYLASKRSHARELRDEYACRARLGFDVDYLEPRELEERFGLEGPGAILSRGNAQVDPFRLTHHLLGRLTSKGLRIHDRTGVIGFERERGRLSLVTDRGARVRTRKVVFATGYESQQFLKQRVGSLKTTFAVASEPLESLDGWPERCLLWETARPYFYLRSTPDRRALMGGADRRYSKGPVSATTIRRQARKIERRFRSLFPRIEMEIAHAWSGTFAETRDGLSYIGETPEFPDAFFALSYGANGITFAVVAGRILTDLCLGRTCPDAHLFRFDR